LIAPLQLIVFTLGSITLAAISRRSLLQPRSHGFYRFFAWEALLAMIVLNIPGWFDQPLAWYQLISWILLVASLLLVIQGVRLLRQTGKQDLKRNEETLFEFEKTSQLVTVGVYRYIRHPLNSSLLFLGWGIFFKSPGWLDAVLVVLCTLLLTVTARIEEHENIRYFGAEYSMYMQHTKMFIPYIF